MIKMEVGRAKVTFICAPVPDRARSAIAFLDRLASGSYAKVTVDAKRERHVCVARQEFASLSIFPRAERARAGGESFERQAACSVARETTSLPLAFLP